MLAVFCFITCDVMVVCLQGWESVWSGRVHVHGRGLGRGHVVSWLQHVMASMVTCDMLHMLKQTQHSNQVFMDVCTMSCRMCGCDVDVTWMFGCMDVRMYSC